MDWLKARSFRKLGSIRATLRVATDDDELAADPLVDAGGLDEFDELELQDAVASAKARPTASTPSRGTICLFMATSWEGDFKG